jgi:hypothetical protein
MQTRPLPCVNSLLHASASQVCTFLVSSVYLAKTNIDNVNAQTLYTSTDPGSQKRCETHQIHCSMSTANP